MKIGGNTLNLKGQSVEVAWIHTTTLAELSHSLFAGGLESLAQLCAAVKLIHIFIFAGAKQRATGEIECEHAG